MPKNNLHQEARPAVFGHARENRKKATAAEDKLWESLRNHQLQGFKFRRQHPLSGFVADFYCHEAKLVIELDGSYHEEAAQKEYDEG